MDVATESIANMDLASALAEARERYTSANPLSLERHHRAASALPGGNTRAVMYWPPFPLTFTGGNGCRVSTLDGQELVDLVSEYSAALYGHSDPVIAAALKRAIDGGLVLGGPNAIEADYAHAIVERFPAIERVRFCNSGTEANVMAISVARAVTGRGTVIAMEDGYHGGVLTFAHGGSELNLPFPFVLAPYNDADATRALIRAHAGDLACVILEGVLGGGGCIPATAEFLEMIREETQAAGALMILDEVMTSRLGFRGLHGKLGLRPDLVTMGKYLGGGASFGCFGGRAELMDRFDPSRPDAFSHGGTFNNNVLSMAGGRAGLVEVLTEARSEEMNARGDRMRERMNGVLERHGISGTVTGCGSMMNVHFVAGPVASPRNLHGADPACLSLLQIELLLRGFYIASRGMIALSLPFGDAESEAFVAAFEDAISANRRVLPQCP
jgi:glutamate-1-semialdehyde 2,1-aminomutase